MLSDYQKREISEGARQLAIKPGGRMKTFTLFLRTSPYSSENTITALKIADSALARGHKVNLIASGDGVYCFLTGQRAKGIPNAEGEFSSLMGKGLKVYL